MTPKPAVTVAQSVKKSESKQEAPSPVIVPKTTELPKAYRVFYLRFPRFVKLQFKILWSWFKSSVIFEKSRLVKKDPIKKPKLVKLSDMPIKKQVRRHSLYANSPTGELFSVYNL